MERSIVLVAMVAVVFILEGCQASYQVRTSVDASSIPDQTYDVTEYRGPMPRSYAVLFDIHGDGTEVFMKHTPFTEKIGLDSAHHYFDEFRLQIRGYRALRISDQNGTVRGYLMASNLLNDEIRPVGERIMVAIEDPYFDYLQSNP